MTLKHLPRPIFRLRLELPKEVNTFESLIFKTIVCLFVRKKLLTVILIQHLTHLSHSSFSVGLPRRYRKCKHRFQLNAATASAIKQIKSLHYKVFVTL